MLLEEARVAYESRYELLKEASRRLESRLVHALDGVAHVDRISFRVKTPESFLRKCFQLDGTPALTDQGEPRYEEPLEEVEDQVAGRVLVLFRTDLEVVEGHIREAFRAVVEVAEKRPPTQDAFGYESDHFVFVIDEHMKPDGWSTHPLMPVTFELQVRTLFMHAYAEPQHDIGYKAGSKLDLDIERQFAWIAASAWGADTTMTSLYEQLSREA